MNDHTKPIGFTVSGIVDLAGGPPEVAKACGVSMQSVIKWTTIPGKHARTVAVLAGLPLEIVRPEMVQRGHDIVEPTPIRKQK